MVSVFAVFWRATLATMHFATMNMVHAEADSPCDVGCHGDSLATALATALGVLAITSCVLAFTIPSCFC